LMRRRGIQLFLPPFPSLSNTKRKIPTSLTLTADPAAIDFLTEPACIIDPSSLEELRLETWVDTPGNLALFLERCAPSLRVLRMAGYQIQCESSVPISRYPANVKWVSVTEPGPFSRLHKLQKLILQGQGWEDEDKNPYSDLPFLLDALPTPSSLSYVDFQYFYEGEDEFPGIAEFWVQVETKLANRTKFTKLTSVAFEYAIIEPQPSLIEWEAKRNGYWQVSKSAGVTIQMPNHYTTREAI
jgi:hypothetical protein